ncbi:MAG: hypothetical protein M3Y69_11280 [Verrucomicrobiota bacterium]|nr:hypothetical protein [Verrucomicrobiota bacterium]
MKTFAILLCAAALIGCTTTETATVDNRPSHRELSQKRVYTQEELQKTGHNESIADALSTVDASITTNHGR